MKKEKNSKFFIGSVVVFLILFGVVKAVLAGMQHLEADEIVQTPSTTTSSTK